VLLGRGGFLLRVDGFRLGEVVEELVCKNDGYSENERDFCRLEECCC
jgi:hypothetical protein